MMLRLTCLCVAAMSPALSTASAVTASQFSVSEDGAATITVPIQVPRGIAGMEPQLALNYSSSAGNGLLGIGWTLSGPSAITRCPKNRALDGVRGAVRFNSSDRYCLDGQRLMLEGQPDSDGAYGKTGTEYRTQKDTFARVTASGQYGTQPTVPLNFKVETKSGLILDFGRSENSRVLTNFPSGLGVTTINRWMLQRISDRHGNFVEFVYCGGEVSADGIACSSVEGSNAWTGSKVIHYVRYTNRGELNGSYGVLFRYESRPDVVQGFTAGSSARQTQRIKSIETYRDFSGPGTGTLVRGYDIGYEPLEDGDMKSVRATNASRVLQIQERTTALGHSGPDGSALPPITFNVATDAVFGQVLPHRVAAPSVGLPKPPLPCGGAIANRISMQCP